MDKENLMRRGQRANVFIGKGTRFPNNRQQGPNCLIGGLRSSRNPHQLLAFFLTILPAQAGLLLAKADKGFRFAKGAANLCFLRLKRWKGLQKFLRR